MKRFIKIVATMILVATVLGLLVKQESFLEAHYDTGERRNVERTSLLGFGIAESIAWTKGGYRSQYREIFGSEPSDHRWHSISKRPIQSSQFFTKYQWSVMTPHAVSLRDRVGRGIFERYERDQSAGRAREAFSELEALLPSTEGLESLDHEDARSARDKAKEIPLLRELIE